MAVTHPDFRLSRIVPEHGLVDLDGLRVVAEICENRRLEVQVSGIAGLLREQRLDVRQGRGGLALPIEYHSVVVAGRGKAWTKFKTALEQGLRIGVPA